MPRGRRRTELLMLAFAVAVVLFAYANVGFGLNGKLPAGLVDHGLALALAVRRHVPAYPSTATAKKAQAQASLGTVDAWVS
jgi:hypothetical protein